MIAIRPSSSLVPFVRPLMAALTVGAAALAGCQSAGPIGGTVPVQPPSSEPPPDAHALEANGAGGLPATRTEDTDGLLGDQSAEQLGSVDRGGDRDATSRSAPATRQEPATAAPTGGTDQARRPAAPARTTESAPASATEAATEAAPKRAPTIEVMARDLATKLHESSATSTEPVRLLLAAAATSLIDGAAPDRDVLVRALPEEDAELVDAFLAFFERLADDLHAAADRESAILETLTELSQAISRTPAISIANPALCTEVAGFGQVSRYDRLSFLAGRAQPAIVYVEIEDFASREGADGTWTTELSQEISVYASHDGLKVWGEPWQQIQDRATRRREDFFTAQVIELPPNLTVGRYDLKIRVRDEQTGAVAETSLPFQVVADPREATMVP